jgi:hypothetical protein
MGSKQLLQLGYFIARRPGVKFRIPIDKIGYGFGVVGHNGVGNSLGDGSETLVRLLARVNLCAWIFLRIRERFPIRQMNSLQIHHRCYKLRVAMPRLQICIALSG